MVECIAIDGLPDAACQLIAGRVYAVVAGDKRLARQLVRSTLARTGEAGLVIADANTSAYLQESALLQAWERGALPVLNLKLTARSATRLRAERLLEELDHFAFGKRFLVIADPADGLLDMAEPGHLEEQLAVYRHWTQRHGNSLLLMLDDVTCDPAKLRALMACADDFAGISRLVTQDKQTHWSPMHWFSELGMHGSGSYRLEPGAGGFWHCVEVERLPEDAPAAELSSLPAALDDDLVYATRAAVADSNQLPANWQVYEDIAGLREASHEAINGTLVIHYDRDIGFESLAREVHAIRQHHGHTAKVMVREMGVTMRHYQEKLLLRIGTNMVVPSAVGFSRFVGMPEQLRGQAFNGDLEQSYEQAVASILPPVEPGYHVVPDFIQAVTQMLRDSQELELHSAVIQLNPLPGVSTADALSLCQLKRQGDICTADQSAIYLHLFACREVDVPVALAHVFELPVSALFVDEVRYIDIDGVEELLVRLQQTYAKGGVADLSGSMTGFMEGKDGGPTRPVEPAFQPRQVADARPVRLALR